MIKKISDKDKKDWKKFIDDNEKLENKDKEIQQDLKKFKKKTLDLHGYSLENANKVIGNFIDQCYLENVNIIKVITGKGSRSQNKINPYLSTDLSILKYSVPNFIKENQNLMKHILEVDFDAVNNPAEGNFHVILKKKRG